MHNGCEELKASYQQLQAELNDEKRVQKTLIQTMQSLKPKEWVIAELEDKLLLQQATGTALLSGSYQRRSDLINGKLKCRFDNSAHIYVLHLCLCVIQLSNLGRVLLLTLQSKKIQNVSLC